MFNDFGSADGWNSAVAMVNERLTARTLFELLSRLRESDQPASENAAAFTYQQLRPKLFDTHMTAYNGELLPNAFAVAADPADPETTTTFTMSMGSLTFNFGVGQPPPLVVGDEIFMWDSSGYCGHFTVTAFDEATLAVEIAARSDSPPVHIALTWNAKFIVMNRPFGTTPLNAFGTATTFSNPFQRFHVGYQRAVGESDDYLRECILPLLIDDALSQLESAVVGGAGVSGSMYGLHTQARLFRTSADSTALSLTTDFNLSTPGGSEFSILYPARFSPMSMFILSESRFGSVRTDFDALSLPLDRLPAGKTVNGWEATYLPMLRMTVRGSPSMALTHKNMLAIDPDAVQLKGRRDGSWSYRITPAGIELDAAYTLCGVHHHTCLFIVE